MNPEDSPSDSIEERYDNFLSLPPELSDAAGAAFVVFTVPFERTTSYRRGTAGGPEAVIEASHQVELFDCELGRGVFERGIATDRSLEQHCGGGYEELEAAERRIVAETLRRGAIPVMIGGEHTITVGGVAAALEMFPDLTVVQIDAHADLRDSYEGDPWSHASAMRRVLDLGKGDTPRLVQAGIRSMCSEEYELAGADPRVSLYTAKSIADGVATDEIVLGNVTENVYLTIDLDGIDPSEAPGVGTPEPGGFSWHRLIWLIERLCARSRIVAFDVVELCPVPGENRTEFLAAKLAYRIMGLAAVRRQGKS